MGVVAQDRACRLGRCSHIVIALLAGAAVAAVGITTWQNCNSSRPLPSLTQRSGKTGAGDVQDPNVAAIGTLAPAPVIPRAPEASAPGGRAAVLKANVSSVGCSRLGQREATLLEAADSWQPPLDRTTVSCTDDDDASAAADSRNGYRASMARRSCIVHNICHDGSGWIAFSGPPSRRSEAEPTASSGEGGGSTSSTNAHCIGRLCSGKPFVYTAPVNEIDMIGARGVVRVQIVRGAPPASSDGDASKPSDAGSSATGSRSPATFTGPNVVWQPDTDVAVPLHRFMPGNLYHSLLSEVYPMYWALRRRMRHPAYVQWSAPAARRCGSSNGTGAQDDDPDACIGARNEADAENGSVDDYVRPWLPANTTATLLICDSTPERDFADRFAALLPNVSVARLDDLLPKPQAGPRERRYRRGAQEGGGDAESPSSTDAVEAEAEAEAEPEHPCSATGRCVCFRTALMGRPGITLAARNAGYMYMRSRSWADPLDAEHAVRDARDFAALLTSRALQLWPASTNGIAASGAAVSDTTGTHQASEAVAPAAAPTVPIPTPPVAAQTADAAPSTQQEHVLPDTIARPHASLEQPGAPVPDTIVLVTREGASGRRALLNFKEVLTAVQKRVQARLEARHRLNDRRARRGAALKALVNGDAASQASSIASTVSNVNFSFNFTVLPVAFERLSPGDTVRLMQRTVLLVGVHGAGLTNMVHMQPGTAVLELVPPAAPYVQVLFSSLAHMLGLRHHGMPAFPQDGDRADAAIGELHDPVRAHADGVAAMVELILQDYDGHCAS